MKESEIDIRLEKFLKRASPKFNGSSFPLPLPKLTPLERMRRRQLWRNQRSLHHRTCNLCQKAMISLYPQNTTFPVYCPSCWWSDKWNASTLTIDFDPRTSFFENFNRLMQLVPRISLIQICEVDNSDYTNDVMRLKDCYLVFDGEQGRDCLYGETFLSITNCLDFLDIKYCELCYECVACEHCYSLRYSFNCFQCSESWFLRDCRGCSYCFGCINLHQQRYCIFNVQHSKEEYESFIAKQNLHTTEGTDAARLQAEKFWESQPVRFMHGVQNENVTGDFVSNSKDSFECYNCADMRDCGYCTNVLMGAKDCYDVEVWGNGTELCYECCCIGENVRDAIGCLYVSLGAERVYYSQYCSRGVKNLFGCIGLTKASNCIFNKSLTAHEFETQAARLAAHMQASGEWGSYFPEHLTPFAYNETVAQEYFPLEEAEARSFSFRWLVRSEPASERVDPSTVCCLVSGRPFKLQAAEVKFLQQLNLPLPTLHPDVRHTRRMSLRNRRFLREQPCSVCKQTLKTTYAEEKSGLVRCECCYQSTVLN